MDNKMSERPTPETDAATHDLSDYGSPVLCSWGDWVAADFARKLERDRDEARAVAGELADVASKYLSFLLAVTPSKTNETHEKETMKVIDAIKRWKKL
jgi:hypothetical protein